MSGNTVRVFVSSPGDVAEERTLAGRLLHRLRKEYLRRVTIEPVLWEHKPLAADRGFQGRSREHRRLIWSSVSSGRGSGPLISDVRHLDGTRYNSGTEVEDALAGNRETGNRLTLWVYRRSGFPRFP